MNHEGVGLGLCISKNIAVALGGDIKVQSQEGVGTKFTLTLPAAIPEYQKYESMNFINGPHIREEDHLQTPSANVESIQNELLLTEYLRREPMLLESGNLKSKISLRASSSLIQTLNLTKFLFYSTIFIPVLIFTLLLIFKPFPYFGESDISSFLFLKK